MTFRLKVLKRIEGVPHRFGGEPHSGWLPSGAATPAPTPLVEQRLDLSIEFDGSGYVLVVNAKDARYSGDSWHENLDDALLQAQLQFGIAPNAWRDVVQISDD